MWGPIIGSAISTGGSLLGGLLSGSKDNYHPEVARNDAYKNYIKSIQAIKDAANKHGFHPLALLGSTPGSSFAAPVPSADAGVGIGDAVGAGISAFGDLYGEDQLGEAAREERAFHESMRRRQDAIDNLRRKEITPEVKLQRENMQLQNRLLEQEILNAATSRTTVRNLRAGAIGGVGPTVKTFVAPGGEVMLTAPTTDSQEIENRYGDIAQEGWGFGNMIRDAHDALFRNRVIDPEDWDEGLRKIPKPGSMKPLSPNWFD